MEDLGLLSNWWRDILGLLGLLGTIASIVGLGYAIWQIWQTQETAEAARLAAVNARAESRRDYYKYAHANAIRFVSEIKNLVHTANYEIAVFRLNDLAEQLLQLANAEDNAGHNQANTWREFAASARQWENTCRRIVVKQSPLSVRKWDEFIVSLENSLHNAYGPFPSHRQG